MSQRYALNLRVATISALIVPILGAVLWAGHSLQIDRTSRAILLHAKGLEQSGNLVLAIDFYDRYVRLRPEDQPARISLAHAYREWSTTPRHKQRAIELYYAALAMGPAAEEATHRLALAELLLETGRFLDAEKQAQQLLDKDSRNAEAHRVFALAVWSQVLDGSLSSLDFDSETVISGLEKAHQLRPADLQLSVAMATLYRDRGVLLDRAAKSSGRTELTDDERYRRADSIMDQLVELNSSDHLAFLVRHQYRARYGLPELDDLKRALELAPEDPVVLAFAGETAIQRAGLQASTGNQSDAQNAYTAARRHFEKLAMRSDVQPEWVVALGDASLGEGDREAAIRHWKHGLKLFEQAPVQARIHARLVDALIAEKRFMDAMPSLDALDSILAQLDSSLSRDERMQFQRTSSLRRGAANLGLGKVVQAIPLLLQAIEQSSSDAGQARTAAHGWALLGQAYSLIEDWYASAVAFDRASTLEPSSAATRSAAAQSWLAAGQCRLAAERAEEAIAKTPTLGAYLVLANADLRLQASLPAAKQDWARFDHCLEILRKSEEQDLSSSRWRIPFLEADSCRVKARAAGRSQAGADEAAQLIARAETTFAANIDFCKQAIEFYEQLGRREDAERVLNRLKELGGDAAAISAARLAATRHDPAEARRIVATDVNDPKVAREALIELALRERDLTFARQLLVEQLGQSEEPDGGVATLRRLAAIDLDTGNLVGVAGWEDKLLAAGPVGEALGRYFRAHRLLRATTGARDPRLREAIAEYEQLSTLRPRWAETLSLKGAIELRLGRLERAADALEQSVELGERRIIVFEQLISVLEQLNRTADCEKYLAMLETELPLSQRLTELAGTHEIRLDRPQKALEVARRAVAERPDDPRALVWLGRVLLAVQQHDEALLQFKRATEVAPRDVRVWNGLFGYHLRRGETAAARETVTRLVNSVKLSPGDRSFVLGQASELLGEPQQAEVEYREAARQSPESAAIQLRLAGLCLKRDPPLAETCLRKALKLQPDSAVARRLLAVLLATRGGERELQEVELLLDEGDGRGFVPVEDRRLKALLLSQRGGVQNLSRAAQLYEEIVNSREGTSSADRLVLARIYEVQSNATLDAAARAQLREKARLQLVLAARDPSPTPIAALVSFHLRHHNAAAAGEWLERLESKTSIDDAEAIARLVHFLLEHGQTAKCDAWIGRLIASEGSTLRTFALRVRHCKQQGDLAAVEQLESEAHALLEKTKDPPEEKCRTMHAIGDAYATSGQYALAEPWYRKLAADEPKRFYLVASALSKQAKVSEAISVCTQAAKQDPAHSAAVLATVLAENVKAPEVASAEKTVSSAVEQFPKDARLLYAAAVLRVLQGRFDESETLLRRVLEFDGKHVAASNNLAMLLAERPESRADALKLIDNVLETSGVDTGLLDTKGAILVYSGQPQEAIAYLESAAQSPDSDPRYFFHLALAYRDSGKTEQAKEEFSVALRRNLESCILTPTDQRRLTEMKALLEP